jgi:hypothetical protein
LAAERQKIDDEVQALAAESMALMQRTQRVAQGAAAPPAGLQ